MPFINLDIKQISIYLRLVVRDSKLILAWITIETYILMDLRDYAISSYTQLDVKTLF
jgi:hypothetical protein